MSLHGQENEIDTLPWREQRWAMEDRKWQWYDSGSQCHVHTWTSIPLQNTRSRDHACLFMGRQKQPHDNSEGIHGLNDLGWDFQLIPTSLDPCLEKTAFFPCTPCRGWAGCFGCASNPCQRRGFVEGGIKTWTWISRLVSYQAVLKRNILSYRTVVYNTVYPVYLSHIWCQTFAVL